MNLHRLTMTQISPAPCYNFSYIFTFSHYAVPYNIFNSIFLMHFYFIFISYFTKILSIKGTTLLLI